MSFILLISTMKSSSYRDEKIQNFVQITKFPHLTLSTSYLQSRVIYYNDFSNILYPEMKKQNKMDYIYAQ